MLPKITARREGSRYGKGWIRAASTKEKIVTVAPIPSVSTSRAVAAKPGFLRSWRSVKRRSWQRVSKNGRALWSRYACVLDLEAAEFDQRLTAGLFRRHAGTEIV